MSVIDFAKREMDIAGITGEDQEACLEILRLFFGRFDSGGAVAAMAMTLQRMIACKPLTPLTGADSEWMDTGGVLNGGAVYQNRRCASVFKQMRPDGTWELRDIDRQPMAITFPYMPDRAEVRMPVYEVGGDAR